MIRSARSCKSLRKSSKCYLSGITHIFWAEKTIFWPVADNPVALVTSGGVISGIISCGTFYPSVNRARLLVIGGLLIAAIVDWLTSSTPVGGGSAMMNMRWRYS